MVLFLGYVQCSPLFDTYTHKESEGRRPQSPFREMEAGAIQSPLSSNTVPQQANVSCLMCTLGANPDFFSSSIFG